MKGTGRGSVICDLSGLEQRGLAAESGPGQLVACCPYSGRVWVNHEKFLFFIKYIFKLNTRIFRVLLSFVLFIAV